MRPSSLGRGEKAKLQAENLMLAAQERLLRGSVKAYQYEAALSWELEGLEEAAKKAGMSSDVVPKNRFELLDKTALKQLEQRWQARYDALAKAAAESPSGLFERPLKETTETLNSLREAMSRPTSDVARFFHRPRSNIGDPQDALAFLRKRETSFHATINEREGHLLRRALAWDGSDTAAHLRLVQIEELPSTEIVEGTRRLLTLDRATGLRPSAAVSQIIKDRFADPLRAVEREAALHLQWEDLRAITDVQVRQQVIPRSLENSFTDWMVSHLTDSDLVEVKSYLDEAYRYQLRTDTAYPREFQGRLDIDLRVVELEYAAVDREIVYRRATGTSRTAQTAPTQLPKEVQLIMERHSRGAGPDLLKSPAGMQAHFEALSRYESRALRPSAEARLLKQQILVEGYRDAVRTFNADMQTLQKLRQEYTRQGLGEMDPRIESSMRQARTGLTQRAIRLRSGLLEIYEANPDRVRAMLEIIDNCAICEFPSTESHNLRTAEHGEPATLGRAATWRGWNTLAPPRLILPEGQGPPFADVELTRGMQAFQQAMTQMRGISWARSGAPPTEPERPSYIQESDETARVHVAPEGHRPIPKGWRPGGRPASFREIDEVRSISKLPGGVALGKVAEVKGAWANSGLLYSSSERRLVLVGNGVRARLPVADPTVLKRCYLLALDDDATMVSIGLDGSAFGLGVSTLRTSAASPVLLHPLLKDTQMGMDMIQADRLPWSLRKQFLPDGTNNPLQAAEMAAVLDEAAGASGHELSDELLERGISTSSGGFDFSKALTLLSTARQDTARLLWDDGPAADAIRAGRFRQDSSPEVERWSRLTATERKKEVATLFLSAVAEKGEVNRLGWDLVVAATQTYSLAHSIPPKEAARAVLKVASAGMLALSLLTDQEVQFVPMGSELIPSVTLRVRFLRASFRATTEGPRFFDEPILSEKATQVVSRSLTTLRRTYPALARAYEYAGWIALFRWALSPGAVAWLDLTELGAVQERRVKTPDYLCRGRGIDSSDCLRQIKTASGPSMP